MTSVSNVSTPNSDGARLSAGKTLALFAFCWIFAWAVGLVAIGLIGGATVGRLRLAVLAQDLIIFVMPAVMTALIASWTPWRMLSADRKPGWFGVSSAVAAVVVAIPAMNWVVEWNQGLHLPAAMAEVEQLLRSYEQTAGAMVESLLGGTSVADLLVALLIVGVAAGVAEELFFRGGLQSVVMRMLPNPHVAIWLTAALFSAIHMQFFGFVPRLLLGAFLGYLCWWRGSVWLPATVHAFNNSLVVVADWLGRRGVDAEWVNELGAGPGAGHALLALASVALTFVAVWYIWRHLPRLRDHGAMSAMGGRPAPPQA